MKQRRRDQLSVIIISGDHHQVRRWEAKRWWFKAATVAFVVILTGLGISTLGMTYYWRGFKQTEAIRVQNAHYDQERAVLLSRLQKLEEVVEQVDRLASRVESSAGVPEKGVLSEGIGPLSENLELPTVPSARGIGITGDNWQLALQNIERDMGLLDERVGQVQDRLTKVYEVKKQRNAFWAALPSKWPVSGWVTSGFGPRRATSVGGTRFHEGIDIAAPIGTEVIASGDGVVTFAGYRGGYGRALVIDHGFGISTIYGHNSQVFVQEGQRIRRGMTIAAIGMTGRTTGPHLHYEVQVDGVPVDPMRYLATR